MRKIQVTDAAAVSLLIGEGALHMQIVEKYTPIPNGNGAAGVGPEVYDDGGERAFNGMGLAKNLRPEPIPNVVPVVDLFAAWTAAREAENTAARQPAASNATTTAHPLNQVTRARQALADAMIEAMVEELPNVPRATIETFFRETYAAAWNACLATKGAMRYSTT